MHLRKILLLFFTVLSLGSQAQDLSNRGKEFWVAWGHNSVVAGFKLYISADNYANVAISIPGYPFTPISDLIMPGEVKTYDIPYSVALMLNGTGVSQNKAIHITSDEPVVAYAHQFASASSAATMLMPVETYGQTYYSLNFTQQSNTSGSYSWFFVIASEDNTRIEVTPSVTIQGGSAGVVMTINLNKGEIYNVAGTTVAGGPGSTGTDVSGSKIKSVAGSDGTCHPIGVFSGCSRMVINGTGSGDIMQQQIFPAQAWGTRYLTSPTVSSTSVFTDNNNVYRVAVRDPATIVKRNGVTLGGLTNNFYYQFQSNTADYIEADKPILVAQYLPTQGTAGYAGDGDPEMFYLSPILQGIKSASFNATRNQAITSNFVNVIVPTVSAASLKVDGSAFWDNIYPHPNLPGYTVKVKRFAPIPAALLNVQHKLTCDSTFTAITYGLASVESYGYNAGTKINNLDVLPNIQNTDAIIPQLTNVTCKNTPFQFFIKLAYRATELKWLFSQVAGFSATQDTTISAPSPVDSSVIQGRKYFHYSLPVNYQFSNVGVDTVPIRITAPDIDNCSNSFIARLEILVKQGPFANFTFTYTGCRLDTTVLHGTPNANGYVLAKYKWSFDDGTTSGSLDTVKYFPTIGVHPVKFAVVADNGCNGDTTINVTTYANPTTTFGITPAAACVGAPVSFSDTSSFGGGSISSWSWDFGNGQPAITTNTPTTPPVVYTLPGDYTITHWARVSSCISDTVRKVFKVWDKPKVNFGFNTGCLNDSTVFFHDSTTIRDVQTLTYAWNFGDANATPGNPNTSALSSPIHRYSNYATNLVKLLVVTDHGCADSIVKPYSVSGFGPNVDYSVANDTKLCSNIPVKVKSIINIAQDSIFKIEIYWDLAGLPTTFQTDITPLQDEEYMHLYPSFTAPVSKPVTIKWVVYSKGGCVTERTKTINLTAMPVLNFPYLTGTCVNGVNSSLATAVATNGVIGAGFYTGTGVDSNGTFHPNIANTGLHRVKYTFVTDGGCTDSVFQNVTVFPKPEAGFKTVTAVCLGDSVLLRDSSLVSTGSISQWQWNFGDNSTAVKTNNSNFYHVFNNFGSFNISLTVVSDSGCISTAFQKSAFTNPLPAPDFAIPPFICMPAGIAAFNNLSTIPNGTAAQLQYNWTFGDGTQSTAFSPTHIYTSISNYNVRLRATSQFGCVKDSVKIVTTFFSQPIAAFTASDSIFCLGKQLRFTDRSTAPGSSVNSWSWNFGDATTSSLPAPLKGYNIYGLFEVKLAVKSLQGCVSDTARKMIRVYLNPIISAGPNLLISEGQSVFLQGSRNDSAVKIKWTPPIYLNNDTLLNPLASPIFSTVYHMTGTGEGNCNDTSSVRVTVLKTLVIPNVFSPNGDGINDKFFIKYLNEYPKATMQIFDRYGGKVFDATGFGNPWDGKLRGKDVPVGVYYYVIQLNQLGYNPITGSVTLLR